MYKLILAAFLLASFGSLHAFEPQEQAKLDLEDKPVCELCKHAMYIAQHLLEQNKTGNEILEFIETEFCGKLGPFEADCKKYVEQYGPTIILMVAQSIEPEEICKKVNLCLTSVIEPQPIISENANCTFCQAIFTEVQSLMLNDTAEQLLLDFVVQKLCNKTGTVSPQCKQLVDMYGPMAIENIADEIDPEKICQILGFCDRQSLDHVLVKNELNGILLERVQEAMKKLEEQTKNTDRKPSEKLEQHKPQIVIDSAAKDSITITCYYCIIIGYKIHLDIGENLSQEQTEEKLYNFCRLLPAIPIDMLFSSAQCKDLLDLHFYELYSLISSGTSAQEACKTVQQC